MWIPNGRGGGVFLPTPRRHSHGELSDTEATVVIVIVLVILAAMVALPIGAWLIGRCATRRSFDTHHWAKTAARQLQQSTKDAERTEKERP